MRQFRITSQNLDQDSSDDCYLDPNDPIHELKAVSAMGGLGTDAALQKYNSIERPTIVGSDKGRIQRERGIKPGTQEWFKHWFSKENK